MQEAFLARKHLDECAEVHYSHYCSFVNFTYFHFLGQKFYFATGSFCSFLIYAVYAYQTRYILGDVNLDSRLVYYPVDGLSSRSDDYSHFIRVDVHGDRSRSVLGKVRTRSF